VEPNTNNPITEKNPKIPANQTRNAFGDECVLMIIDLYQDMYGADAVAEYVNEGEHQDGGEYWNQFVSVEAAAEDFVLYMVAKEEFGNDG